MNTLTLLTLSAAMMLASSEVTAQESEPPQTSMLASEVLVIRGRLVDLESGEPIRRCSVRLTGHQGTGYDLAWSAADWTNPPEITTMDDGRFRLVVRVPGGTRERNTDRYHLRVSHPQYCSWFSNCAFDSALGLGGIDYGDIRLPKGVRPRIRCVDSSGKLQAGVSLHLRPTTRDQSLVTAADYGPSSWVEQYAGGRTDIDGYLHLTAPLLAGEYTVGARGRKTHKLPGKFVLPSKDAIEVVVKALPAERTIAGRLVDDDDMPVSNAKLELRNLRQGPSCTTRRDGHFTLIANDDAIAKPATISMARNGRYDNWANLGTVDWGTTEAKLVVPSLAKPTFEVVDEQGAAITAFNIYCLPSDPQAQRPGVRLTKTVRDGRALCRVAPGDYQVLVVPRSNLLQSSGWRVVTVEPGEHDHRIRLKASQPRNVSVVFAGEQGGPAAGAFVEVITGGEPEAFEFVPPITSRVRPRGRRPKPTVIASVASDAQGIAHLWLPDPGEAYLRVSGDNVQTRVLPVDLSAKKPQRVEVQRGGRITCQFTPASFLQELDPLYDPKKPRSIYSYAGGSPPKVNLVFDGGKQTREWLPIDHTGRFSCGGIPPGEVELQLVYKFMLGASTVRMAPPHSLGKFTIDVDKPLELKLEVPQSLRTKKQH